MNDSEGGSAPADAARPQRADARRSENQEPLPDAAESVSVEVDAIQPQRADVRRSENEEALPDVAAAVSVGADAVRPRRADARRNEEALLDAAAAVFVEAGVQAPVRDIAARAGVGTGTIYRHFPTRADLIIAVYRHQVEACAEAGPELLASGHGPYVALGRWIGLFVDFLVTKHGLARATRSDEAGFETLHAYFLARLVPVCARLLAAAVEAGEIRPGIEAFQLMHGVGNLCIGADRDPGYDARRLVELLVAGLRRVE